MTEFKKLQHLLDHHLHLAWVHRSQREKILLGHGLAIELYIEPGGRVHLPLWRLHITPSAKEFDTVLRHWPWEVPSPPPVPTAFKNGKRHCLTATFRVPDVHDHWTRKESDHVAEQDS